MGKLIVIEGGDGAGKTTQIKLLEEALRENMGKVRVELFDFPRYDSSVYGKLVKSLLEDWTTQCVVESGAMEVETPIMYDYEHPSLKKCLSGEFGDFVSMSPYLSSLPYILDRAGAKEKMIEALRSGHVICNRYITSNIAYQSAKLPEAKRDAFIKFIEDGEYGELELPRPDLVVYLYVPQEISKKLVEGRAERLPEERAKDQHEKNFDFQTKVAEAYKELCRERRGRKIINCAPRGELLASEEIHKEVLNIVRKIIG